MMWNLGLHRDPQSARVSEAPVFSDSVAGPATLSMKDRIRSGTLRYPVTVTVTYNAAPVSLN